MDCVRHDGGADDPDRKEQRPPSGIWGVNVCRGYINYGKGSPKKTYEVPRRQKHYSYKHYSYNESVNESPRLIEDEPVEIEEEIPAEENEPLERIDKDLDMPVFEE
jgi:hypothetical protein